MFETLKIIGNKLNNRGITWGVGGSLLLHIHDLIANPNDIDLLVVEEHAKRFNELIAFIGESKEARSAAPFRTTYFTKYRINNTDIDIMGGFAIEHSEGIYKLTLDEENIVGTKNVNGVTIPLCSLEDWYILYWLIPGKQEKAVLIEEYFKENGIHHASLLEKAIKQPLPLELKERVEKLLEAYV